MQARAIGRSPPPIEEPSFRRDRLTGLEVPDRVPIRMLEVDRMQRRVRDVQQLMTAGADCQREMSGRVTGRIDRLDAGHDLGLAVP